MPSASVAAAAARNFVIALALAALLAIVVAIRYQPSAPRGADAPATEFSATRAQAALATMLGDGAPHPIGTPAHAAVRDRLLSQLRDLGYSPEVQIGSACDEWGNCAQIENLVARLDGREPGAAVLMAAHYDSVGAGPGAADDGAGVATVLEIARALRSAPAPRHAVILLLSDGEEVGLFGARVFADGHRWAREVKAAVNIEARGSSGPSVLFETGRANRWAMRAYAPKVQLPITNSIYYTAYQLLPNDTDFTVFKAHGWQGYNFAFSGSVQHYHTPLDDLAHLSLASVQHQGDNALAMLRVLANADVAAPETQQAHDAVYLDLMAATLLQWPASWAPVLAGIVAVLWLALAIAGRPAVGLGPIGWSLFLVVLSLVTSAAAAATLLEVLRAVGAVPPGAAGYQWTARPLPLLIAMTAWTATVLAGLTAVFRRRVSAAGLALAFGLILQLLSLLTAFLLPGASFALLLPATAVLVWGLRPFADDRPSTVRDLLTIAVSLIVLLPTVWFLYPSLGLALLPAIALLIAWMAAPLLPVIAACGLGAQRRAVGGFAVVAVIGTMIAARQPAYSVDAPQRVNIEYALDADSGQAEWLIRPDSGVLPQAFGTVATFARREKPLLPASRGKPLSAPAPAENLPAPTFTINLSYQKDGVTHGQATLSSVRGAPTASVCFAPEAGLKRVIAASAGQAADAKNGDQDLPSARGGWRCVTDHTLTHGRSSVVTFERGSSAPFEVIVSDRSYGLPASGKALRDIRPANAVPSQDGDVTRVFRRMMVQPAAVSAPAGTAPPPPAPG
ncbi:M20/M25/M40 family metallo-hydrolase [Nevskia sp.]|uniref:M20/M25/M40 family metallo-hydrolase n=1 Tax=Nevskia sp. TaxID=1929292 RepID=UPI0025FB37C7|nr:M20/M25/M40 family metallo-hydrolase [Nevskia sp.]